MGHEVKLFDDGDWGQQSNQDRLRRRVTTRGVDRTRSGNQARPIANSEQKRSPDALRQSKMGQHDKAIACYEQRQIKLRAQISALKGGVAIGDDKTEIDRLAAIRRIQRQIADLERAIVQLRESDAS